MAVAFTPIPTFSSLETPLKDPGVKIRIHLRKCVAGKEFHLRYSKPLQLLMLGHLDPHCVSRSSESFKNVQMPRLDPQRLEFTSLLCSQG